MAAVQYYCSHYLQRILWLVEKCLPTIEIEKLVNSFIFIMNIIIILFIKFSLYVFQFSMWQATSHSGEDWLKIFKLFSPWEFVIVLWWLREKNEQDRAGVKQQEHWKSTQFSQISLTNLSSHFILFSLLIKTFKLNLKLSVAFKKIAMNLLIINLLTNSFRNFVMNSSSLNRCFWWSKIMFRIPY